MMLLSYLDKHLCVGVGLNVLLNTEVSSPICGYLGVNSAHWPHLYHMKLFGSTLLNRVPNS